MEDVDAFINRTAKAQEKPCPYETFKKGTAFIEHRLSLEKENNGTEETLPLEVLLLWYYEGRINAIDFSTLAAWLGWKSNAGVDQLLHCPALPRAASSVQGAYSWWTFLSAYRAYATEEQQKRFCELVSSRLQNSLI